MLESSFLVRVARDDRLFAHKGKSRTNSEDIIASRSCVREVIRS